MDEPHVVHIPTGDEEAAKMFENAAEYLEAAKERLIGYAFLEERAKIILLVDEFRIRARALTARHQNRREA